MEAELFSRIAELLEKGEPAVLVTQVAVEGPAPREAGARMLVFPGGHSEGAIGGGALEHRAIQEAEKLLSQGRRTHLATYELMDLGMLCGGRATLFDEVLAPKVILAIFGAGHVGSTLARLARETTPFKVELYDDREERCREELAPGLAPCHLPGFEELPELPARCYVVVCTDSHATDFKVVEKILRGDPLPPFVGMLGSRVKAQEVKKRLASVGIPEERVEKLRSPVGLPIGGKSPGEIAISILSELLAFHHGRLSKVEEWLKEGG